MSAAETGQMSAAETGHMSAAETRQMSTIATRLCLVLILCICLVSTADICPVATELIYPVSTEDIQAGSSSLGTRGILAPELAEFCVIIWCQDSPVEPPQPRAVASMTAVQQTPSNDQVLNP